MLCGAGSFGIGNYIITREVCVHRKRILCVLENFAQKFKGSFGVISVRSYNKGVWPISYSA